MGGLFLRHLHLVAVPPGDVMNLFALDAGHSLAAGVFVHALRAQLLGQLGLQAGLLAFELLHGVVVLVDGPVHFGQLHPAGNHHADHPDDDGGDQQHSHRVEHRLDARAAPFGFLQLLVRGQFDDFGLFGFEQREIIRFRTVALPCHDASSLFLSFLAGGGEPRSRTDGVVILGFSHIGRAACARSAAGRSGCGGCPPARPPSPPPAF